MGTPFGRRRTWEGRGRKDEGGVRKYCRQTRLLTDRTLGEGRQLPQRSSLSCSRTTRLCGQIIAGHGRFQAAKLLGLSACRQFVCSRCRMPSSAPTSFWIEGKEYEVGLTDQKKAPCRSPLCAPCVCGGCQKIVYRPDGLTYYVIDCGIEAAIEPRRPSDRGGNVDR